MAGHSKWNNIKEKRKDGRSQSKIFTKIGRELAVAVKKEAGRTLTPNSKLKDCIAKQSLQCTK